jgi:hypothetical protein
VHQKLNIFQDEELLIKFLLLENYDTVIMKWRENQNQVSIGVVNQMIYQ